MKTKLCVVLLLVCLLTSLLGSTIPTYPVGAAEQSQRQFTLETNLIPVPAPSPEPVSSESANWPVTVLRLVLILVGIGIIILIIRRSGFKLRRKDK